jgi:hypothetical protein
MKKRVIVTGMGVLIAAACAALVIGALRARRQASPSGPPGAIVPAMWHDVRASTGHQVHVAEAGLPCRDCHAIEQAGFAPPRGICRSCHSEVDTPLHDSMFGRASTDCQDCHGFGADPAVRPWQCMRCHDQPQGFVAAVGRHGDQDCGTCHQPHAEPVLTPQACEQCHADQQAHHGRAGRGAASACLDCHSMHEPGQAADQRCAACHRATEPRVPESATFAGHDRCVGCHPPHDFSPRGAAACASCHAEQRTLGQLAAAGARTKPGQAPSRRAHAQCTSCHRPHDVRRPAPCTSCHAGARTAHPADAQQGPCLGCHPIHPDAAATAKLEGKRALACSACHTRSAHGGDTACSDCHDAHGALRPAPDATLCSRCHAPVARSTAGSGHAACLGCHVQAAHAPATPVPACGQCHGEIAGRVARGHATCTQCHASAAHAPRAARPACETCHPAQRASAPAGHRACANCHETHSGGLRPRATCGDCHARERATGHGVTVGCASCHRPHGPGGVAAPPGCHQCHASAELPGMHRAHERARCSACHRAHEAGPRGERASCAACHRDLAGHEPTTNTCTGCHVFRR